jgi:hypothetical protein
MFMQAWGNYGTVWPVVHQMLGVRPDLGRGALIIAPAVPEGQPSVAGTGIRLGGGKASVRSTVAGNTYTTETDTSGVPGVSSYKIGVVVRGGSPTATATLDGAPVTPTVQDTPQGTRYVVPASPGQSHTFVVTNG